MSLFLTITKTISIIININLNIYDNTFNIYDSDFNKIDNLVIYVEGSRYCCIQFILNYINIVVYANYLRFY